MTEPSRSLGPLKVRQAALSGERFALCGSRLAFQSGTGLVPPCPVCAGIKDFSNAVKGSTRDEYTLQRVTLKDGKHDYIVKDYKPLRPSGSFTPDGRFVPTPPPVTRREWVKHARNGKHHCFSGGFHGGSSRRHDYKGVSAGAFALTETVGGKVAKTSKPEEPPADVVRTKASLARHHKLYMEGNLPHVDCEFVEATDSYVPVGAVKDMHRFRYLPTSGSSLEGGLLKQYLKARHRGYLGTPSHWLKRSRTSRNHPAWSRSLSLWTKNPILHWSDQYRWARGDSPQADAANKVFSVYCRPYSKSKDSWNRSSCRRLARSSWPEERYPSSPTLVEWERRRLEGKPLEAPAFNPSCFTRLSWSQFRKSPKLWTRLARLIVGVRSDFTVIPSNLTRYFRYRWNFLILPTTNRPPALTRFLVTQWLGCHRAFWTRCGLTARSFLDRVPNHWLVTTAK